MHKPRQAQQATCLPNPNKQPAQVLVHFAHSPAVFLAEAVCFHVVALPPGVEVDYRSRPIPKHSRAKVLRFKARLVNSNAVASDPLFLAAEREEVVAVAVAL